MRQAARDAQPAPPLCRRQVVLDKYVTMAKELPNFPSQPCSLVTRTWLRAWTDVRVSAWACERLSFLHRGHSLQHRLGQLFKNMEFGDLAGHLAKHRLQRLRIQGRAIRGHAPQHQAAQLQGHPEAPQEGRDALVVRGVIKHLVQEPFEGVIVDNGQNAKRPIIQLIDRDVPREVRQAPVQVARPHLPRRSFPPQPPPSFGWWRREQTRGDHATNASSPLDRATRPQ